MRRAGGVMRIETLWSWIAAFLVGVVIGLHFG